MVSKVLLTRTVRWASAALAAGVLFNGCVTSINIPGGSVVVGEQGVKIDFPGLIVDVNDSGVFVQAPGVNIDLRDEG
jgi:hypothetical protein